MSTTATITMRDYLAALALDSLDASEAEALRFALERDDGLREQHAALVETAAALAEAAPVSGADAASVASVRARLFDAPASALAPGLFERFGARFAAIFDVTLERAKELLGLVDDPLAWEPGPGPGSWLVHFQGGPAVAGADTGFVKLAPGARFPWHRHHGHEHSLILAGIGDDSLRGHLVPGDEPTADGATEHDFVAAGDQPYLFAVRVWGVDFTVPRPDGR